MKAKEGSIDIHVRITKDMKRKLIVVAEKDGRSLSNFVKKIIYEVLTNAT